MSVEQLSTAAVGIAGREAIVQVNEQMAAHGQLWPAVRLRVRELEPTVKAWMRHFEEGGNRR